MQLSSRVSCLQDTHAAQRDTRPNTFAFLVGLDLWNGRRVTLGNPSEAEETRVSSVAIKRDASHPPPPPPPPPLSHFPGLNATKQTNKEQQQQQQTNQQQTNKQQKTRAYSTLSQNKEFVNLNLSCPNTEGSTNSGCPRRCLRQQQQQKHTNKTKNNSNNKKARKGVPPGLICVDICTSGHTKMETTDATFYLIQALTPASTSTEAVPPGVWQRSLCVTGASHLPKYWEGEVKEWAGREGSETWLVIKDCEKLYTRAYAQTHARAHTHTRARACTHTHTHPRTNSPIHTHTNVRMRAHTHTHTHECALVHPPPHTHTYTHPHPHPPLPHTHTHIYLSYHFQ